jgi:hypothetical protein
MNPSDAAINRAAVFARMRGEDERPAVEVAGALVFAYVRDGTLRVSIDLDTADELAQGPQRLVPVTVTVQGHVVYAVDGTGRDLTPLAGMDPTRPIHPDPSTTRGFTVIGHWRGRQPTVTAVLDGDRTHDVTGDLTGDQARDVGGEAAPDTGMWAVWVDTAFEAAAEHIALERLNADTHTADTHTADTHTADSGTDDSGTDDSSTDDTDGTDDSGASTEDIPDTEVGNGTRDEEEDR